MSDYVLVWDLETIPDLEAVGRVHDLKLGDEQSARDILGDKFPKHPFHKIVCIGAIIARIEQKGWRIISRGAPHVGERTEGQLIESFVGRIAELQPTLVTFNGNGFDLPVLRYRAMVHRISAPGLIALPYFNRYSTQSVDLCDVLASYGTGKATLHEISRTLGFAGKASGIDGSNVATLYADGRIQEIADYCIEDVTNTYRIWLTHELFCGRLTPEQYQYSEGEGRS
jgi:predicted PolB exonuclease-like 3'-5' exonuclease